MYMHVGGMYFMCTYVLDINVYVWLRLSDKDPLVRSRPNLDSCSSWTLCTGHSKTDSCDDPEIHTGSCSED